MRGSASNDILTKKCGRNASFKLKTPSDGATYSQYHNDCRHNSWTGNEWERDTWYRETNYYKRVRGLRVSCKEFPTYGAAYKDMQHHFTRSAVYSWRGKSWSGVENTRTNSSIKRDSNECEFEVKSFRQTVIQTGNANLTRNAVCFAGKVVEVGWKIQGRTHLYKGNQRNASLKLTLSDRRSYKHGTPV